MKKVSFDTQLIASAPTNSTHDKSFTDRVMSKLKSLPAGVDFIPNKNTVMQSFFSRLSYLPKFVVVLLAVAALTLLSGTAYAAYKVLWEQPQVTTHIPTSNEFGRTQIVAKFENCIDQSNEATFEIKSGSKLDSTEVGEILQARCELMAIQNWSGENAVQPGSDRVPEEGVSQSSMVMVYPSASKVVSISNTELSLTGDEYAPEGSLDLNESTQFIANNTVTTRDQIRAGDTVLFVQNIVTNDLTARNENNEYVTSGMPTSREITYVIKVNLPFEYYNASKQNQIAQRQDCLGNTQDSCVQAQLIDLYSSSPSGHNTQKRTIQGIITEHKGNTITIQASSGRTFTINTPYDIVSKFNQNTAANNGLSIGQGDLIQASYIVKKDDKPLTLNDSNILSVQLGLNIIRKNDSVEKY